MTYERLGTLTRAELVNLRSLDFVRHVSCLVDTEFMPHTAAGLYATRYPRNVNLDLVQKSAVSAGTSTDGSWASPLVNELATAFVEWSRPATLLGRVTLRRVPFAARVPVQTAGGSYGWVGEAKPKPLGKLAFTTVILDVAKAAGNLVLTNELVKLSTPSAVETCRADMSAGIAQFLDQQFLDPAVAAVAGVDPGSITNGTTPIASGGNAPADLRALINAFVTGNPNLVNATLVLSPANLLAMFPGQQLGDVAAYGIQVIASPAAGTNVILFDPTQILYTDDGGIAIEGSKDTSLQMDSAPASPADATTVMVSMFQTNCVALRAERFVSWKRARLEAVRYVSGAVYAS